MARDKNVATRSDQADEVVRRREDRLNHVVDTSARLFAERGFGHVGMAELCGSVGLGRGQLYALIGSKENLLKLIHDRFVDLLCDSTARVDSLDLSSPAERLRELLSDLLTIVILHRDYAQVFFNEGRVLTSENRRLYVARRLEYLAVFEDTLAAGAADGSFRIKDTRVTVVAILGMVIAVHEWLHPVGTGHRDIADAYCDLVLNGILSASSPEEPNRIATQLHRQLNGQ